MAVTLTQRAAAPAASDVVMPLTQAQMDKVLAKTIKGKRLKDL